MSEREHVVIAKLGRLDSTTRFQQHHIDALRTQFMGKRRATCTGADDHHRRVIHTVTRFAHMLGLGFGNQSMEFTCSRLYPPKLQASPPYPSTFHTSGRVYSRKAALPRTN